MPLTPDEFNKLFTKEDGKQLKDELRKGLTEHVDKRINDLIDSIDSLTKKVQVTEEERLSNIRAHERYEARLARLEEAFKLSSLKQHSPVK